MNSKLFLFSFLFVFLLGCSPTTVFFPERNLSIDVEIADTDSERMKGLMFRDSLEDYEGLLFIFEDTQPRTFWMKNTSIPLDIIFISENFIIINIENADPCSADPCKLYPSLGLAKYVLEVKQNFSTYNNLSVGDRVIFS